MGGAGQFEKVLIWKFENGEEGQFWKWVNLPKGLIWRRFENALKAIWAVKPVQAQLFRTWVYFNFQIFKLAHFQIIYVFKFFLYLGLSIFKF